MVERLKTFHKKSNRYPERILVYRDGVSEVGSFGYYSSATLNAQFQGQFAIVVDEELPAITAAFRKINPTYRPKLTIVVCV